MVIDLRRAHRSARPLCGGEVSQSGLHGANRLASNSLLECFVFGDAAADAHRRALGRLPPPPPIRAWDESRVTDSDEEVVIKQNWTEIRRFMWNYVGIVRTTKRLERAPAPDQAADRRGRGLLRPFPGHAGPDRAAQPARRCAELIVRSALHRKESRGLHYTLDYPKTLAKAVDTVLAP